MPPSPPLSTAPLSLRFPPLSVRTIQPPPSTNHSHYQGKNGTIAKNKIVNAPVSNMNDDPISIYEEEDVDSFLCGLSYDD
jgi:hypothetical protein